MIVSSKSSITIVDDFASAAFSGPVDTSICQAVGNIGEERVVWVPHKDWIYEHKFEGRESRLSSAGTLYLSFFLLSENPLWRSQ